MGGIACKPLSCKDFDGLATPSVSRQKNIEEREHFKIGKILEKMTEILPIMPALRYAGGDPTEVQRNESFISNFISNGKDRDTFCLKRHCFSSRLLHDDFVPRRRQHQLKVAMH